MAMTESYAPTFHEAGAEASIFFMSSVRSHCAHGVPYSPSSPAVKGIRRIDGFFVTGSVGVQMNVMLVRPNDCER